MKKGEIKFLAFYCIDDLVVAVDTLNRDPIAAHFANLRKAGQHLKKANALNWGESLCLNMYSIDNRIPIW